MALSQKQIGKLTEANLSFRGDNFHMPPDRRSVADSSEPDGPEEETCATCLSIKSRRALVSCGHWWCRFCLRTHIRQVVKEAHHNQTLWPPHCCATQGEIGEGLVRWVGDRPILLAYRETSRVMAIPATQRTYCYDKTCGAFIPPDKYTNLETEAGMGDWVATCGECERQTCVLCRGQAHPGQNCPVDEETMRHIDDIVNGRMQMCPQCGTGLEKIDGCNVVRCMVCRRVMCWVCTGPWPCNMRGHNVFYTESPADKRERFLRQHRERMHIRQLTLMNETQQPQQLLEQLRGYHGPLLRYDGDRSQGAQDRAARQARWTLEDIEIDVRQREVQAARDREDQERAARQEEVRARRDREDQEIQVTAQSSREREKLGYRRWQENEQARRNNHRLFVRRQNEDEHFGWERQQLRFRREEEDDQAWREEFLAREEPSP